MSCDLHIHSTCSDGAVPIERLAPIAARTGLHAIALSDHDTLLSAQYAYAHTGQDGVELIPAVELTGYDFERQHRVHLLCYYPDADCPALREHCAIMKERRNACALQSAKELEQLYPQFTTDLAWETTKASGVLFKSGLMQALELLGLTEDEVRFYDALATNESAVKELTDETLKKIAHELTENLRQNLTVDWSERESVRAKLRLMVKRVLRKYKYPPDLQEEAVDLVLRQAQVFGESWGGG